MIDIGQPRWWPLTGIVGILLIASGALLPGLPPPADAQAPDIAAYFIGHGQAVQLGTYLTALGTVIWLWFSVALYWVLRKTEVHAVWSLAYLAATILVAALTLAGLLASIVLSQPYMKSATPTELQAMNTFLNASGAMIGFGAALLTLAASLLIVRSGIVPHWIGWLGLLDAVLQWGSGSGLYIASGPFSANGLETLIALAVFSLWTIAVAAAIMMKPAPGPALHPEAPLPT